MRIGINIPNDLMRRLEPLKPELNISQVCREALEAKAVSHERMLARLDDGEIQEAIEMVWEQEKKFLAVIEVDWEVAGYEGAEAWTKAAEAGRLGASPPQAGCYRKARAAGLGSSTAQPSRSEGFHRATRGA